MIAVLRYGAGVPHYRLARLQASVGMPLPTSTQWDVLDESAEGLLPVFCELIRQGAQFTLAHNDDTPLKVLARMGKRAEKLAADGSKPRAVFTSGIVLIRDNVKIALFFTGQHHAGENLAHVLSQRARELPAPIQMCDALSRNVPKLPGPLATILAHCLAHGRRQFVDVIPDFPDECRHVIETLADVYRNDALAKQLALNPAERLALHQTRSKPILDDLHAWLVDQRDHKRVEPNSGLGQAIAYMLKHWKKLTLFLKVAGAPLDNTICERALKKAILHRKNSLFYKTQRGAEVGDLFMSLMQTCELNRVNPWRYLTELFKHKAELQANPADWMPWNYVATLEGLASSQAACAKPSPAVAPAQPPTPEPPPPASARRSRRAALRCPAPAPLARAVESVPPP